MAISWGAYEGGMRVGIDVSWEAITTGETQATATVRIYTDNSQSFSDNQTLNYGGSISGSTNYTNDESGSSGAVLRSTRSYTYTYGASEYGSSPGSRTFSASASGLYTGGTPSKSVSSAIPARPYAAPNAPSSVAASRISDTQTRVSWARNATSQKPYTSMTLQKAVGAGGWVTVSSSISGSATTYTDTTAANQKVRYQIRANNSIGSSGFVASGYIYTSPATPQITAALADVSSPTGKRITVAHAGQGYTEYTTDIIGYKNGVSQGVIGNIATGVTTFDHTTANAIPYTTSDRWKYTARHKAINGNTPVYSAETAFTNETPGVTSPPNAPTNLSPDAGATADPSLAIRLSWQFNSTDTSDQTQLQVRHRVVGAGSWTTEAVVATSNKYWDIPANTYSNGQQVEWQVTAKGADATWSPWSASATFLAFLTKIIVVERNLGPGVDQVDLSGYEWKVVGAGGQPAFQNSWVSYGAPYRAAMFCRRAGVTWLGGLVKNGTAGSVIFTLPVGYRPGAQIIVEGIVNTLTDAGVTINDIAIRLEIYTNGDVKQHGTGFTAGTGYFSLEGISFLAEQ